MQLRFKRGGCISRPGSVYLKRRIQIAVCLVFTTWLIGCKKPPHQEESSAPGNNLIFLGIDGASWNVLIPNLRLGMCPATERILVQGVFGNLTSFEPMKSPSIWTSMATGKNPAKHGIEDFVQFVTTDGRQEKRLMTSNVRRVRALWEMLSERGISNSFIAWWASWPAERTKGLIATSHVWPFAQRFYLNSGTAEDLESTPHRTYPESLINSLKPYNFSNDDITSAEREKLMLGSDDWYHARDLSYFQQARYIAARYRPQALGVYIQGIDACSHPYWLDQRKISRYYQYIDDEIAALLTHADATHNVLLCSDHGFRGVIEGSRRLPQTESKGRISTVLQATPGDHYLNGVIIAAGPAIKRWRLLKNASVLDICPTTLGLLGLPAALDMDGRLLLEIFDSRQWRLPNPIRIASYDKTARPVGEALETSVDDEIIESLKRLGYAL